MWYFLLSEPTSCWCTRSYTLFSSRRQLPPVPSQSPPRTPQASGTYVTPQQNEEMNINQLYGSSKSRPRSPTNGMLSVHFDPKNQSRSGELASSSKRQTSLNYFISSDEEHEEATKQRKPAGGFATLWWLFFFQFRRDFVGKFEAELTALFQYSARALCHFYQ